MVKKSRKGDRKVKNKLNLLDKKIINRNSKTEQTITLAEVDKISDNNMSNGFFMFKLDPTV